MTRGLVTQHLRRAWSRHWGLQIASVTVMSLVLVMLNLLFLSFSGFNSTIEQWGRGLEMTVYLREPAEASEVARLEQTLSQSGEFEQVRLTSKEQATRTFLASLGPESLELLSDPKWSSPIPASLDVRLKESVAADGPLARLEAWSAKLKALPAVDDVFYGQGWVENFSRFIGGAKGLLALFWILSLCVGLLIVSNCIRLSFSQRRDEIEILELVGATSRFIRTPFLLEGLMLGLVASIFSLAVSYVLHRVLLDWIASQWSFWSALRELTPMRMWYVALNLTTGLVFGLLGAWNCVRKLNTGWSAATGE